MIANLARRIGFGFDRESEAGSWERALDRGCLTGKVSEYAPPLAFMEDGAGLGIFAPVREQLHHLQPADQHFERNGSVLPARVVNFIHGSRF